MGVPSYHPEHARAVLQSIRDRFGLGEDDPHKAYLRGFGERCCDLFSPCYAWLTLGSPWNFIPTRRISF